MATIGYYDLKAGHGTGPQAHLISDIGQTGLELTGLSDFGAAQVLYIDNPSNTAYSAEFLAHETDILTFAEGGGIVVMNDRLANGTFIDGFTHDAVGQYADEVDFVNDHGVVADGPGGTLTDFSLDHYGASNHGVMDISLVEDEDYFAIATAHDPTKLVAIYEPEGAGAVLYSTIPTDQYVAQGDANMTAFAENLIQYAVDLQANSLNVLDNSANVFKGSNGGDLVFALDGNDLLKGRGGDDLIHADAGNDKVIGGIGDDVLWGCDGRDLLKGGAGNDQLWGEAMRDKIAGGGGDDFLSGGSGEDVLKGGSGDNTLLGGSDNDVILGGDGFDKISGGSGGDHMTGGGSADTFFFGPGDSPSLGQVDLVTDFVHGQDSVDLTAYGHDFTVSTAHTFSGTPNEMLIYEGIPNGVFVAFDFDGDSSMDAFFELDSDNASDEADVTDFVFFH